MDIKNLVKSLCSVDAVSGYEKSIFETINNLIKDFAEVSYDHNGNIYALMGDKEKKKIMIDAHIDQIGFLVTQINEKGFIKLAPCGGIDRRVLSGTKIKICGKKIIYAVVSCLPPHLSDGGEDKAISKDSLWVDCGLSADEVKEIVSIGDQALFSDDFTELLNDNVSSPALDNRASVAALIYCANLLKKEKLNCCVEFCFTSREEYGLSGAKTAAYKCDPEEAIVVDVTFGNQQGFSDGINVGDGVMIGISPVLNRDMTNKLRDIADENKISYGLEVMGRSTGTNADTISLSKCGVKTALLSIPQKNMHTQCEIVNINDIKRTGELIYKYIKDEFND